MEKQDNLREEDRENTEEVATPRRGPNRRGFLGGAGAAAGAFGAATFGGARPARAEVVLQQTLAARRQEAFDRRVAAAQFQFDKGTIAHVENGDDARYTDTRAVFGKGLPHNALGEPTRASYQLLKDALATGDTADFDAIPLGFLAPLVNPQAALAYDLVGADSHAVTIPPAPTFASAETAGEMVEVYWQALTRDVPFTDYEFNQLIANACADLSALSDFRGPKVNGLVIPATLFRQSLTVGLVGPYISQFLWMPIPYGVHDIEQRYYFPETGDDYGLKPKKWLDIQRGVPQESDNVLNRTPNYIANGRDLGEYVHQDFSYQAYINAALILLDIGSTTLDVANPYLLSSSCAPFSTFGGPDILSLLAHAANAALHAAWFQKWGVHRRLRPEAYAGRLEGMRLGVKNYDVHADVLNSAALAQVEARFGVHLLPLAYPEGSPQHPSYPAGHATMAGACCTILKAFFNEDYILPNPVQANADGSALVPYTGPFVTVGSELSKLASNISLGRDTAGVHWRTDGVYGMQLGEDVAIALLEDFRRTYEVESGFSGFTFRKFDGTQVII